MGMTLTEKILSRVAGKPVRPGEIAWIAPDLVTTPEVSFPTYVKKIREIGIKVLPRPQSVVVAIDHETPVHSVAGAERNQQTRRIAVELNVGHLFDGEGITHPLIVERGLVRPGMFVAGADTHTTGLGGIGALSMPFGMEVTMVLATGKIWLKVPETIRVRVRGSLARGVTARDVILATMARLGTEDVADRVVEYTGECIAALSVPERMTISGLTLDMGAEAGIVAADRVTLEYLRAAGVAAGIPDLAAVRSDDDAQFALEVDLDASQLVPQASVPPSPTCVQPVTALAGTAIQHAYIGSCVSGTVAELRAAAELLRGRRVHPGVQMLVIPATLKMYREAAAEGVLDALVAAGASIAMPSCGPCFGGLAQLAAGEVRISTSTRNDPGRMGSKEAQIYLASALTVTASAIAGRIADPRPLLEGR